MRKSPGLSDRGNGAAVIPVDVSIPPRTALFGGNPVQWMLSINMFTEQIKRREPALPMNGSRGKDDRPQAEIPADRFPSQM